MLVNLTSRTLRQRRRRVAVDCAKGATNQTYLDKRHDQSRIHVPLNMAMKHPDTRVVRPEPHHKMSIWPDKNDVSAHGYFGQHHRSVGEGFRVEIARLFLTTEDSLEHVAVQVERMFPWVLIVEYNFDDAIVLEDEGVRVGSIDAGIACEFASTKSCVESGDFRGDIGDTTEEGIVL